MAAAKALRLCRQHAMFLEEADVAGRLFLEYDDFFNGLPDRVRRGRTEHQLRSWFDLGKPGSEGCINLCKFVELSTAMAKMVTAVDILTGRDEAGFTRIARELGYGDHASNLFAQLCLSRNGTMLANEIAGCKRQTKAEMDTMRDFMIAMGWNDTEDRDGDVCTDGWSIEGSDPESMRMALLALLEEHGVKLSQIFETLDMNDDNVLTSTEFSDGLQKVGFAGERAVLIDTFSLIDDDGTGKITFNELNSWLRGRASITKKQRMDAARGLVLRQVSVHEEEWNSATLRRELRDALAAACVQVIDLLEAFDVDGSGELTKKEWLVHFKKMAVQSSEDAWYDVVRSSVEAAFAEIDLGGGGALTVGEIERWLKGEAPRSRVTVLGGAPSAAPRSRKTSRPRDKKWSVLDSLELELRRDQARLHRTIEDSVRLRTRSEAVVPRYRNPYA